GRHIKSNLSRIRAILWRLNHINSKQEESADAFGQDGGELVEALIGGEVLGGVNPHATPPQRRTNHPSGRQAHGAPARAEGFWRSCSPIQQRTRYHGGSRGVDPWESF